ncbi:MAG: metallophosphoesterase [Lachnospiraceae bacterium]|nr:metallophosphoesterase [Lachnospiraceae bacterium]
MKKFLVIDDLQQRQDSYNKVFNFIELDFAFSKKEFLIKIENKYDGYFVDVIYEDQQYEDYSFQQIIEKIPDKKPLFIISEQWSKAMDGIKMRYLRNGGKYNNVLGYLSWNIINEGDKSENVKDFVREQINNYYDVAYGAFEDDQSITILQISDIEFGNPGQDANIEFAQATLKNKIRKNLRKLGITSGKVDFICICGDIAYEGKIEEYKKAKEWLRTLGEEILMNENFENLLIVPGNHDFCYNSAAGNYYLYDKEKRDYVKREDNITLEYNEHGMHNFAKFVYELNGDKSYILEPYRPILKRTYEDYGINFVLLNPIKIGKDKKFTYGLSDSEMKFLIETGSDMGENGICNIVLSHLATDKYSMVDPTSDSTDRNIRDIVDELNIKGWFEGHAHDDARIDDILIGNHKVLVSRTEPLMLRSTELCEKANNGFTIFKLHRKKGKVINISYFNEEKNKEISFENLFS